MPRTLLLTLLTALLSFGAPAPKETSASEIDDKHYRIYRGDGTPASMDELLAEVRAARVAFLGESHDDPVAHHLEERIFKDSYQPTQILSLEMFESDVQTVLDEYLADLITEDHLKKSGRAWKNYDSDYRPLIEWAKEKDIPVVAANAPRRYVNRVGRLGAESLADLTADAKASLPPLPYADASPAYTTKFTNLMKKHRSDAAERAREEGDEEKAKELKKEKDYTKSLQAQSLWDAGMAYSIAEALQRHPGSHVLHVNGSFHSSRGLGILDHLARYRPNVTTVVITMLSNDDFPQFDEDEMTDEGDFVIVTDPSLPRTYGVQSEDSKDQKKE